MNPALEAHEGQTVKREDQFWGTSAPKLPSGTSGGELFQGDKENAK
jgi:hypothetical protein